MSKPKSGARNSNFRRNNPKRGAPGILVITETGRENKGRREGLEILQHYFYSSSESNAVDVINGKTQNEKIPSPSSDIDDNNCDSDKSSLNKNLTLEEEIALLKKGVSADAVLRGGNANANANANAKNNGTNKHGKAKVNSGPFRVYETGCRGTVFFMSTMPNCELISVPTIAWKNKDDKSANEEEVDKSTVPNGHDEAKASDSNHCDKEKNTKSDDISGSKRKRENDKIETDQISAAADGKKQKTESSSGQGDEDSTLTKGSTEDTSNKWDPIQTVDSILDDIRTQNIEAPRSRFVTRMVPMQVTCFASMEEIEAHVRILIAKYLMPIGIEHHAQKQKKKAADAVTKMPSFKIEFKRRNCSHIRRDNVVQSIANIVESLTADHWKMQCPVSASTHPNLEEAKTDTVTVTDTSSADAHTRTSSNEKKDNSPLTTKKVEPLFSVNLTNPDYSIVVELCRTLCGLSVIQDPKSFQNFNLMRVQEEIQDNQN